jgi:hypothetical protein
MKHIFVSHAGADKAIATILASDLRDAGHETKVDTKELTLGTDSIDFMNQAIADAHTVIILFSRHTENARWQQLEINASLWNEVAQDADWRIKNAAATSGYTGEHTPSRRLNGLYECPGPREHSGSGPTIPQIGRAERRETRNAETRILREAKRDDSP